MDRIFLCSLFSFSVISPHFPFFSSFFSAACDKHQTLAKELVWHLGKIWPALSEPKKCRIPGFRHHISCGSIFFLDVAARHVLQISFLPSLFHQGWPLYSPNSLMAFPKNIYWNILESPWHLGYILQTECQKWLFFVNFLNQPDHFDWSKELSIRWMQNSHYFLCLVSKGTHFVSTAETVGGRKNPLWRYESSSANDFGEHFVFVLFWMFQS